MPEANPYTCQKVSIVHTIIMVQSFQQTKQGVNFKKEAVWEGVYF